MIGLGDINDVFGTYKDTAVRRGLESRAEKAGREIPGGKKFADVLAKEMDSAEESPKTRAVQHKKEMMRKKLKETCVEMESLFVGRMLKEMRKTVHKNELFHGGYAEEIFEDMLYDEYALNLSKNSRLGLADMLYKELSRKL